MSDFEKLVSDLAKSSVALKKKLYRRDENGTSISGSIPIHMCRVCNRSAAGKGAEVKHRSDCALKAMQESQKALRALWPAVFQK
jgi:hypothetical protein